jgi:hypothetical protein
LTRRQKVIVVEHYWEAWGLLNAIDAVLESLAQQPPIHGESKDSVFHAESKSANS